MSKLDTTYQRIRELRIKRGMTQAELGEAIGYKSGKVMIYQIEKGIIDIPLNKLKAIANALDVTTAYLAGYEDDLQEEDLVLAYFRTLNAEGRKIALEYMRMLSNNEIYTNSEDKEN